MKHNWRQMPRHLAYQCSNCLETLPEHFIQRNACLDWHNVPTMTSDIWEEDCVGHYRPSN